MDTTPELQVPQGAPHPTSKSVDPNRLSLSWFSRVCLGALGGFLVGASSGATHGSQEAGLRFRAENSHRLPKSDKGWYLYHKSKNYQMMLHGIKGAFRTGARLSFFVGGFFAAEEVLDRCRGRQDFLSTTIAGASLGGLHSQWHRLSWYPALRTVKLGLLSGLGLGVLQDAIALAKGRRLGYVDFLLRRDQQSFDTPSQVI